MPGQVVEAGALRLAARVGAEVKRREMAETTRPEAVSVTCRPPMEEKVQPTASTRVEAEAEVEAEALLPVLEAMAVPAGGDS
jgi:hypothetical protein